MENTDNPQPVTPPNNGKTVAVVSYFTLIGWIVALVMHGNNKTRLGAYHLRQMAGLMLLFVMLRILQFPLFMLPMGWAVSMALGVLLLVLWIIGLIAAINGQEKPIPVLGDLFQKWFAGFAL